MECCWRWGPGRPQGRAASPLLPGPGPPRGWLDMAHGTVGGTRGPWKMRGEDQLMILIEDQSLAI